MAKRTNEWWPDLRRWCCSDVGLLAAAEWAAARRAARLLEIWALERIFRSGHGRVRVAVIDPWAIVHFYLTLLFPRSSHTDALRQPGSIESSERELEYYVS